ncbi:3-deoxy-manno-octulosonate cytidylyltransferase [Litorivicinus sp.]|nr:3-deoxy-manno-octulosonate cytidylyltransferase [Litorivicinus sp.]MDC1240045.1 3-deoxy-manno-octulosonate cytidylyltransferase [Litorivicinus sp.]MDC1319317.1 3-deoxy-manno-octulosonate cytidylyltransferase [Litorivicinus sp.]
MTNFVAVIPARYGSTRLPGKPLLEIEGRPMVWHVYQRAIESNASTVIVATDDQRIMDAIQSFGGNCLMTDVDHLTGTDRLAEVAAKLKLPDDAIVVNVQGDEPLIPAIAINQVAVSLSNQPKAAIATLCEPFKMYHDALDPSQVKVVFSKSGRALYFSRAIIPGCSEQSEARHYRHIGIYAYRAGFLRDFSRWSPTLLEQSEHLEQLRALEHDRLIHVDVTEVSIPPGVDTEQDLMLVRQHMASTRV